MQVGSNVVLKRQLSQGGMGSIWVGEHRGLQIDVAVKFLAPELARNEEAGARFKREAAAAAQVKSPHVVSVFDHGVTDQALPFIVMELLEGEDLGRRIERLGPRPLSEVVRIVNQLASALAAAHSQGIIHRDIKPENVFLVETQGELFVKLLDFGIAKRVWDDALSVTSTGIMMGTPYFMSPEQVVSTKAADARSDMWSVGAVTYVALTARMPFQGETLGAVCYAIVAGEFVPVTQVRRDLPPALDAWFNCALHGDPARRFASVREMAAKLERVAGASSRLGDTPNAASFARSAPSIPPHIADERGASPPSSQYPTKFEATLGVAPAGKHKSHMFGIAASVLAVLVFASIVGATLVLSPKEIEDLKLTLSRAFGKAPTTAVHSSSPERVHEVDPAAPRPAEAVRPLVTPSLSAKPPESARPNTAVAPKPPDAPQPSQDDVNHTGPGSDATSFPRSWSEDLNSSSRDMTEPPPSAPEDPYAPEVTPRTGEEEDLEEARPRPPDEPDYGI
jgi:serine/threonine-protein kinase